jgi:HemY protein
MRLILLLLLVLIGVSLLTSLALEKPGFVLLAYDQTTIEVALFDFIIATAVIFIVFYMVLRFLVGLIVMPSRLQERYARHQEEKAHKLFYKGLLEFSEGRWARAERLLLRSVWNHHTPLLGYLAAARAAQMQSAYDRRDEYLKKAIESDRSADVAVGLLQAELQMSREQNEQALATLRHLRELAPRHAYVLELLARLYRSVGDWEELGALIPELRKSRALPVEQIDQLESGINVVLLDRVTDQGDEESLTRLWKSISRKNRQNPRLIEAHARAQDRVGQHGQATAGVLKSLDSQWDEGMVRLLGELQQKDPIATLGHAESWLRGHGDDPILLLTLGRLSMQAELWGKARLYLENSVDIRPASETFSLLGDLLTRMGDEKKAQDYYRRGLGQAVSEQGQLEPSVASPDGRLPSDELAALGSDAA